MEAFPENSESNTEPSAGAVQPGSHWQRHKRRPAGDRRLAKFIGAAEAMLASLQPEIFSIQQTSRIALLFGPSPSRPCEVYDVTAAVADAGGAPHIPLTAPATLLNCCLS